LLLILEGICGTIDAMARASARRRLRQRLRREAAEQRRIADAINRRSEFIRLLYHWPQSGRAAKLDRCPTFCLAGLA
jgi:hypothetical protein